MTLALPTPLRLCILTKYQLSSQLCVCGLAGKERVRRSIRLAILVIDGLTKRANLFEDTTTLNLVLHSLSSRETWPHSNKFTQPNVLVCMYFTPSYISAAALEKYNSSSRDVKEVR